MKSNCLISILELNRLPPHSPKGERGQKGKKEKKSLGRMLKKCNRFWPKKNKGMN